MPFPRRRHQSYGRLHFIIPIISAISGALLLLFAILLFLTPVPMDIRHYRRQRYSMPSNDVRDSVQPAPAFRIPDGGGSLYRDLWSYTSSRFYYGCSNASGKFAKAESIVSPNHYLAIATSGGLNQQRTGITDAVVAARMLNATLVIPRLDQKSYWRDSSNFADIFDVDWFISFLSEDVRIIKQLPRKGGKTLTPYSMRVPRKCSERCYRNRVLPLLLKRHAVQLSKFDYRLANKLDTDYQKLRCRANYHALKFTSTIANMGIELVKRMRKRSQHYIALHLRFEPDMLAFSGCYYGGGEKEKKELGALRRRWKTLHVRNPEKERRQGKCPLTPEEVGLMLRALGYDSDVYIYVASGDVYGGEETLAPLKALFPHIYSKDIIASKKELEPFTAFSSRMAALDFIVCDESDIFITNNNGNMAKILAGRRRYFGHKPTIRPNSKKLYRLFLSRDNMTWDVFASKIRTYQRGFMGEPKEVRPGRGEFHENPSSCICEEPGINASFAPPRMKNGKGNGVKVGSGGFLDTKIDDENESSDPEDDGGGTDLDYDGFTSDEPELEEMFSD